MLKNMTFPSLKLLNKTRFEAMCRSLNTPRAVFSSFRAHSRGTPRPALGNLIAEVKLGHNTDKFFKSSPAPSLHVAAIDIKALCVLASLSGRDRRKGKQNDARARYLGQIRPRGKKKTTEEGREGTWQRLLTLKRQQGTKEC